MSKGDVDGDQIDDLLIGSPYASTCGAQCGIVGVLFSRKKRNGILQYIELNKIHFNSDLKYRISKYNSCNKS